jgi:hypothetical protein
MKKEGKEVGSLALIEKDDDHGSGPTLYFL